MKGEVESERMSGVNVERVNLGVVVVVVWNGEFSGDKLGVS